MNKDIKIGVIGGDARQLEAAYALDRDGFRVICYGVPERKGKYCSLKAADSLEECVCGATAVLLGVPFAGDGKHICTNDGTAQLNTEELLSAMTSGQLILGGRMTEDFCASAKQRGISAIDYFEVESLSVANAVPTAEGAVAIAMDKLDITLHGARALVIGYGRVGKVLSKLLFSLGCHLTVAARRSSVKAWCDINGYNYTPISQLSFSDYDVIFNTVPYPLITGEKLEGMGADTLIIDLASAPGGVDMLAAAKLECRVIRALSLPGKVAFKSAGRIIKDTALQILEGEGII